MDRITSELNRISELSDEELSQLQAAILSEFDTVEGSERTQQSVDAMTSLADSLDTVRSEASQREANAQILATRATEASVRVKGDGTDVTEGAPSTDGTNPADPETPAEDATEPAEELAAAVPDVEAPAEDAAPTEETPEDAIPPVVPTDPAAAADVIVVVAETEPADDSGDGTDVPAADDEVTETPADEGLEDPTQPDDEEKDPNDPMGLMASTETEKAAELSTSPEPTETPTTDAQPEQKEQEAPVTAAVQDPATIEVPEDHAPITPVSTAAPVTITAGADVPGLTAGTVLDDLPAVASAFEKRIRSLRNVNGGDGEQHIVASFTTSYPEERVLTASAAENWAKIQAVVGPEALMASGGFQAPFEVKYDVFGFGTDVRPVRDSLVRFQADRGGIRYIIPPVLSDYENAVGIWSATNDVTPSSPSTKASLTVSAASEMTGSTDAVTLQLQFGNLVTRAYPELIARHNELALVMHARLAENTLLANIAAASTAVTSSSIIGVARDWLVQLGRATAAYRSRWRLDLSTVLQVIVPAWVKDAMVADLTLQMPGDSAMNASAEIEGYISSRNVHVTWTLDGDIFGAQGTSAVLEFPDTFAWYLFSEGTFLFLDGGTLDLGIIRDSTLVGTNDYKMFSETFEKAVKVGIESLRVTSTISVNGAAAALRDTTGAATASAIEY